MEKILEVAATQVPGLAVLAIVVILALRALRDQAKDFTAVLVQQRTTFVETLKREGERSEEITEACHAVAKEAAVVVKDNTRVLGIVEKRLEDTGNILRETNLVLRERSA